jgi:hypothetical protein
MQFLEYDKHGAISRSLANELGCCLAVRVDSNTAVLLNGGDV